MQNLIRNLKRALTLVGVVTLTTLSAQTSNTVDASSLSGQIMNRLSQFETNKSVEILKEVLTSLQNTEDGTSRKERCALWMEFLTVLDKNIDPNFNPTNANFSANLVPPPDGGVQYASGVDPQVVKDPVARASYEAALKANKEKAQNYELQLKLHRVAPQAELQFNRFLRSSYTSSENDQRELNFILEHSKLSLSRKEQIKKSLEK
jgi:hypothetical protein